MGSVWTRNIRALTIQGRIAMSNKSEEVFLLDNTNLVPMSERTMREGLFGKTLEDSFQALLEKHPEVIPGKQISPGSEDPPRFLLLRREMPVNGWSLDHLFVDQHGMLTLVEAKLNENPESRRAVIGQIVEYASNAKTEWANGVVRKSATDFYLDRGRDIDEALREHISDDLDIDEFWKRVDLNLREGRMRLIIAGDEIRVEVRRMIEFLNDRMPEVNVLGLEIKFYGESEASLVMVPRIVGQTQESIDRSASVGKRVRWTEPRLRQYLDNMSDEVLSKRIRRILDWAVACGVFKECESPSFVFGIRNISDNIFFSVRGFGDGHVGIAGHIFPHDGDAGRGLLSSLGEIGLLRTDKAFEEIKYGRDFATTIDNLDDDSFNQLFNILEKYSG